MEEEQGDDDQQGRDADREHRRPDEASLHAYEDSDWRVPDPKQFICRVEDGHPVVRASDLTQKQREMLIAFIGEVSWSVSTKWQAIIVEGKFSELIRDVEDCPDESRYAPHRPALILPGNWQDVQHEDIPIYERPGVRDSPNPPEEAEIVVHEDTLVNTRRVR